jgi:hypothetical protein
MRLRLAFGFVGLLVAAPCAFAQDAPARFAGLDFAIQTRSDAQWLFRGTTTSVFGAELVEATTLRQTTASQPSADAITREAGRGAAIGKPARATSRAVQQVGNRGRSKWVPVFVGLGVGALVGFWAGSNLDHAACEIQWDCPPGVFTWGFTAIGAGAGAGVGWLVSR